MSKTSFSLSKWSISKRSGRTGLVDTVAGVHDSRAGAVSQTAEGSAGIHAPIVQTGLPCDWLFRVAAEALLIAEAPALRVVEANPAAAVLLGTPQNLLLGAPILEAFAASEKAAMAAAINRTRSAGRAVTATVRTMGEGRALRAKISFFQAGTAGYVLVRLASTGGIAEPDDGRSPVFDAIEGAPLGFLIADAGLRIEYANQAFADMAELPPRTAIRGKSVLRWLEFYEGDMARLQNQMLQRQATMMLTARLRSTRRSPRAIEVCAVAVPDGELTCWGFTIRELPTLN